MCVKKILVDLTKLSNLNCGLGEVSINFGLALSKLKDDDIELNFLVPEKYINHFGKDINYYTKKTIKTVKKQFDLWHSIHQDPEITPPVNTKLILTIHDLNFLGEKNKRKANKRLANLQKIVDTSHTVCFISEFTKKVSYEHLNFTNKKTSVLYNGLNKDVEMQTPEIKSDKFLFSMGVFKPKKNFHVLIPVMKYFPKHKLIIAGDTKGRYFNKIKKIVRLHEMESQVIFPGIISNQHKRWYYNNCDAFIFPSLYEGFGIPVLEAMQKGVPVITSDKTSLPEIGGGFTFIFDSFDELKIKETIEKGIITYKEQPNFKQKAIEYSQKFCWENNAKQYLKIYKEIN